MEAPHRCSFIPRWVRCHTHLYQRCIAGSQPLAGQRVIEIGAGVGLAGLTAAQLGAQVVLTDLPDVLPGLHCNIEVRFSLSQVLCVHDPLQLFQ